jgi:geranylgeranyl pyrophosphate synthase
MSVQSQINLLLNSNSSGLLREMADYHFSTPGRMVRPQMILKLGEVLQAPYSKILGWAVCCEIFHNATLIHDDIQDEDCTRRGQTAVWKKYGLSQALNLGDFLLLLAPQAFISDDFENSDVKSLLKIYSKMSSHIVNGQSHEMVINNFTNADNLLEDYEDCALKKTAALFEGLSEGVASLSAHKIKSKEIAKIHRLLGKAFQIQDDILDLWGFKNRLHIGTDVMEGKVSFLVAKHLKTFSEDTELFRAVLQKPRGSTTAQDVLVIKEKLEHKGTLECSIQDLSDLANHILDLSASLKIENFYEYISESLDLICNPISHLIQSSKTKGGLREFTACP